MKKNKTVAILILIVFMAACLAVVNVLNYGVQERERYSVYEFDINSDKVANSLSGYVAQVAEDNANSELVFVNYNEPVYATSSFFVRSGPGVFFQSESKLYYGQEVTLTGVAENGWCRVRLDDKDHDLYVYGSCLVRQAPTPRFFTDDYGFTYNVVNRTAYATKSYIVLTEPSLDGHQIGVLGLGEAVNLLGTSPNGWNCIEYNGQTAYVYGECITATNEYNTFTYEDTVVTLVDATIYSNARFTIRVSPDALSEAVGELPYGTPMHLVGICDNGYYLVQNDEAGITGYAINTAFQVTAPPPRSLEEDPEDSENPDDTDPEGIENPDADNNGDNGNTTPDETAAPTAAPSPETQPTSTETEPSATEPPATEPPATEPPATEPPATEPPATEAPAVSSPSGSQNPGEAQRLLAMVNAYRADNGLGPLSWSGDLEAGAQIRAQEIAIAGYFGHTRPDGTDFWTANDAIYGENIAAGQATAEDVFNSWINSDGHRNNILNPGYTTMGCALFNASGSTYAYYWTQEFGY